MDEVDAHPVSSGTTTFGIQPASGGRTPLGIREEGTTTRKGIDEFHFRKILLNIDRNLLKIDILALKYLCLDKSIGLRHGELEKVNRGLDLLEKLERRGLLSKFKLEVLIELLGLIERFDLQGEVEKCLDLQQKMKLIQAKKISSYRAMILDFASDIEKREMESLKPLLKSCISARTTERLNEPIKLMIELEKLTVISPQKLEFLFQVADYLQREDLIEKLEEFKATSDDHKMGVEKENHISKNTSQTSSGNEISTLKNTFESLRIDQPPYHRVNRPDNYISHVGESLRESEWPVLGFALGLSSRDMDGVRDSHGMLQKFQERTKEQDQFEKLCSGLRSRLVDRPDIAVLLEKDYRDVYSKQAHKIPVEAVDKEEETNVLASTYTNEPGLMERYSMNNMPRGICLIINNMNFVGVRGLKDRRGSEVDEVNLKNLFLDLEFNVIVERNATAMKMKGLIEDVRRMDHTNYDCFVCCILSHGDLGTIFSSDEVSCKILEFTSQFRPQYCPSLAGKPKLFFLQACQGSRRAEDFEHFQVDAPESGADNIPDDADFLLGYATAPGNVSFRSKTHGSWYVTKLTNALQKYHNTHHILDILTHVNNEVSKAIARESKGTYKQVPAPQFTLRKQLYLTKM